MIGTTLKERYRIESKLGRGGMGEVFRATDMQNGETVAIKALNAEVLVHEPDLLARFIREGEALRALNHPNIVRMIAAVEDHDKHYLAMEFVEGGSLHDLLTVQTRLSAGEALKIALEVSDALSRAHHLGIIHRDLKPANVLIAKDGTPRLADFGIAHMDSDQPLTQTGVLIGTVDYVSPEVCQGERPDERSDIWAFGVMLFEMLSGRLPFEGTSLTARLTAILTQSVPDLAQLAPEAPLALVHLVYRMLEKDPQQRMPSARLLGAELEAILKGSEAITPTYISVQPKPTLRNNLPTNLSRFIGREKEIAEVVQAMNAYRLVTLTGSGGVGKTRLSLQVAMELLEQFSNGVWFVELAPITDPDLIPQTILLAMGAQPQHNKTALENLTDFLHEKTALLVLDNCEHLIEACAKLTNTMLNAAPNLNILASSREVLGVDGEKAWHVPSLSVPDLKHLPAIEQLSQYESVRLFIECAKLVLQNFSVNMENAPAVAQICSRLDGIPLAIELAAARVKVLKPEQIAERLDNRFRLLTGGSRTALPRQQTLRALIDWSYELLSENERLLLRRSSVFMGGWTLELAEQVCADEWIDSYEVLDMLGKLVDKSLVAAKQEKTGIRYRILETVRQYAREKLFESGEGETLRDKHMNAMLEFAEKSEPEIRGANQLVWLDQVEAEYENVRAALEWSRERDNEICARLVNALWCFLEFRGYILEEKELFEQILELSHGQHTVTRATGLSRASVFFFNQLDYKKSVIFAQEAIVLARELNEKTSLALALVTQGGLTNGNPEFINQCFDEAIALCGEIDDHWQSSRAWCTKGLIAEMQGDRIMARACLEKGLREGRLAGDRRGISFGLKVLGDIMLGDRKYAEAKRYTREGLDISRQIRDTVVVSRLVQIAFIDMYLEDYEEAESLLLEALEECQQLSGSVDISWVFLHMAWLAWINDDFPRFAGLMHQVNSTMPESEYIIAMSSFGLGTAALFEHDLAVAKEKLITALTIYQKFGTRAEMLFCLPGFGMLALENGQLEQAAKIFGVYRKFEPHYNPHIPFFDRKIQEQIETTKTRLGYEAFDRSFAQGQEMTIEQAATYALEITTS